jgi:hypothetical protein
MVSVSRRRTETNKLLKCASRTFGSNRFDMIHHRYLCGHVSDYAVFYKRIFDALRPGGSVQCVEIEWHTFCDDGSVPEDSAMKQWGHLMTEAFAKMGRAAPTGERYKQFLEDAGFENVSLHILKRPHNDWPKDPKWKEIGRYCECGWGEMERRFIY